MNPDEVLNFLLEGNRRFRQGESLARDFSRAVSQSSESQHPLAVVLSCIDSRAPIEIIFDLGLGDVFGVRIAGNVVSPKVFGSMEYACMVAGARLILVLGHTRCGAVAAAVETSLSPQTKIASGCDHVSSILGDLRESCDQERMNRPGVAAEVLLEEGFSEAVGRRNVLRSLRLIRENSPGLAQAEKEGKIKIVGAVYDISTGRIDLLEPDDKEALLSELTFSKKKDSLLSVEDSPLL